MWQDISRSSGLPFSRSTSASLQTSDNARSSLVVDRQSSGFDYATLGDGNDECVNVSQLQHDLLRLTNHAIASELEVGNLRDRNRMLEEEIQCLEDRIKSNDEILQARALELSEKEESIQTLTKDKIRLRQTEQDILARVAELESDLAGQKAEEETLRLEMQNTVQELLDSRSKNEVLENRVVDLQDNLRETVEASKKRESTALAIAQTEAKHTATILESKLQSCEQQLAKAEEREAQALLQSQEARQETSNLHQSMTNNIASTRREMSAQHRAELDKINIELDASKQEITHLSDQLQEAKNLLVKQTEKSAKNLNAAECRVKDINNDLESKTKECERLQAELDEVRYDVDILILHISVYNLQHMICPSLYSFIFNTVDQEGRIAHFQC